MARRELIIACTLIGAVGGALFGYPMARTGTWPTWPTWHWNIVASLTLCTAFSATLLGWYLSRRADDAVLVGGRATWASFVAGALNGALMVIPTSLTERPHNGGATFFLVCAAAVFGTLCALPFAPAIVVVAMTAAYADARVDSIAARSQGRRVLRNGMACLAFAAALIGRRAHDPLIVHLPLYVLLAAALGTASLIVLEVLALRTLAAHAGAGWEPAPEGITVAHALDFGVGHGLVMQRAHDETYRAAPTARETCRGDRLAARALIDSSLRGHAIATTAVGLAVLVTACR